MHVEEDMHTCPLPSFQREQHCCKSDITTLDLVLEAADMKWRQSIDYVDMMSTGQANPFVMLIVGISMIER